MVYTSINEFKKSLKPTNKIKESVKKSEYDILIENFAKEIVSKNITIDEGFLDNLKNSIKGIVKYDISMNYQGSEEAKQYVETQEGQILVETLMSKLSTPSEAKSAIMYFYDKSGKDKLNVSKFNVDLDNKSISLS